MAPGRRRADHGNQAGPLADMRRMDGRDRDTSLAHGGAKAQDAPIFPFARVLIRPFILMAQKTSSHRPRAKPEVCFIYGIHAVLAALANPDRDIHGLWAAKGLSTALRRRVDMALDGRDFPYQLCSGDDIATHLARAGKGHAPAHQGLMIKASALAEPAMDDVADCPTLIACDQITDPHNLGAIIRSSQTLGAGGILIPRRHSPPLDGALAKAASGALEHMPCLRPANLRQSLDALKKHGFFVLGLGGDAPLSLEQAAITTKTVLVLGGEQSGLRPLTRRQCDQIARIPASGNDHMNDILPDHSSAHSSDHSSLPPAGDPAGMHHSHKRGANLNVSNAAAIALYVIGRAHSKKRAKKREEKREEKHGGKA